MGSSNSGSMDSGSGLMSIVSGALGSGGGGGGGKGTQGSQTSINNNIFASLIPMLEDSQASSPAQPQNERSIDQGPFVGSDNQSFNSNMGMK